MAAVLLGMLVAAHPTAQAGVAARAIGTQDVSSGSFAVVPTTDPATPPPGALTLTYAAILSPPAQYFDAVNTGSIPLIGATYSVAVSGGGLLGDPSITLAACTGGSWDQSTGSCSGTEVALGTWSASATAPADSSAAPAVPGTRLGIKASISATANLTEVTTATISISVSSGPTRQIRAANITDS